MSKSKSSSQIWTGQEKHVIALQVVRGRAVAQTLFCTFLPLGYLSAHGKAHSSLEGKADLTYSPHLCRENI